MLFNESGCWAMLQFCWPLVHHRSTFHPCSSPYKTDTPEKVSIHHLVYSRVVGRMNVIKFKVWPTKPCQVTSATGYITQELQRYHWASHIYVLPVQNNSKEQQELNYLLHALQIKCFHGTIYEVIRMIIWMPTHFPNLCINSKMLCKYTLYSTSGWQENSSHNWPVVSWVANVCKREAEEKDVLGKPKCKLRGESGRNKRGQISHFSRSPDRTTIATEVKFNPRNSTDRQCLTSAGIYLTAAEWFLEQLIMTIHFCKPGFGPPALLLLTPIPTLSFHFEL